MNSSHESIAGLGRLRPDPGVRLALALSLLAPAALAQSPAITEFELLNHREFLIAGSGSPGASHRVVVSADLSEWDTLAIITGEPSFGAFAFVDRAAPFVARRFYGLAPGTGDDIFPTLTITNPPADAVLNQPTTSLAGTASDNDGIREIRVNDTPIPGTTSFSTTVALTPGTNRLLVSATDLSANRNRRSLIWQVTYLPVLPTILAQPVAQTNEVGTTATFTVSATGTAPLSYQWRKDGEDLTDGPRVTGAASPVLAISNVGAADVAGYAVRIANFSGATTSEVATLTLTAPPGLIPILGPDYAENFDSLGETGTTTPAGWFVGTGTGAVAGTTVTPSTGSSTAGGNYHFGSAGSSDRALGSLASGAVQRDTEARFINASGSNLVSFTIAYTGEQWRQGGASAVNNDLVLQFSQTGTNFAALGSQFNFSTPYDTGPAGALDGNQVTNRVTGIGGVFVPSEVITNGGVFYLRWVDADNTSSDHAIALDDLSLTFAFEAAP